MARLVLLPLVALRLSDAAKDARFLAKSNATADRLGSFLVIGDWGFDSDIGGASLEGPGCQNDVSTLMEQAYSELGDVRFVLNLGDSFYVKGVNGVDDPRWDTTWRNKYSDELRNVPWYSVYGNHDYGEDACACRDSEDQCAQTQYDKDGWKMPDLSYNIVMEDLNLEIIALDTNLIDEPSISMFHQIDRGGCGAKVAENLRKSKERAMDLLQERLADTSGPSRVLIINHYPTNMWKDHGAATDMLELIQSSEKEISVYGGHTHTMSVCDGDKCEAPLAPISPQKSYLVGSGGGWFDIDKDIRGKFGIMQGFITSDNIENQPLSISQDQCKDQCVDPQVPQVNQCCEGDCRR